MSMNFAIFLLIFLVLLGGISSASATPSPAKIVSGIVSNVASALFKWLWSLKSNPKTAIASRSMMKFERGYTVETVFDGSKLGIEPYSVAVSPSGELLVVDSENSNIYKVSTPLSRYSRPKLVAGSPEGYTGHVDGKPREARMNHPKGLTVDDRGNIYVADTMNMAIRKISDAGVVTFAGGNLGRGGGHVDGPSEDAKFSNDFDVVYIGSSCSILVVDRGNQAIREIQLNEDDCSYHNDGDFQLGMAVLAAAAFFGYMLALLQRRVGAMFSSPKEPRAATMMSIPQPPYQRPMKSVRPPLIPSEDDLEQEEDGLFGSMGKLVSYTGSAIFEIIGGLFSRKKPLVNHHQVQQNYKHPSQYSNTWSMQESFVIPHEDQPPKIESRDPTPRKNYPFMNMAADTEKPHHFKQNRTLYGTQSSEYFQQQQRHQQHHQRHYSSGPQTYYQENRENAKEIVFGAVQEQDGQRGAVVIKAVHYGNPVYGNQNMRSRYNYMGYSFGY